MRVKTLVLIVFLSLILLIPGWCINLYKFCNLDFKAPYKAEIIRGISIFPLVPVGGIVGWINIEDN